MPIRPAGKPGIQPGGKFFPALLGAIEGFPIVLSCSPDSDRAAGGVSVTLTGLRFTAGSTVSFGGVAATAVVIVSPTTITCNTSATPEGIVDIVVTNLKGETGTLVAAFSFVAGHITTVSPNRGLTTGGQAVLIKGVNFIPQSIVRFGSIGYRDTILADHPIGYWPLGEASGVSLVDYSGNGKTITLTITTGIGYSITGAIDSGNTGLSFDGAHSFNGNLAAPIVTGTTFSLEFFFTPNGDTTGYEVGFQTLLVDTAGFGGLYYRSDVHKFDYFFGISHLSNQVLVDGTTYHVVLSVVAGAGTWYINSVPAGTIAAVTSLNLSRFFSTGLGGVSEDPIKSTLIDEFIFFPSALTQLQVSNHFNARSGTGAAEASSVIFVDSSTISCVSPVHLSGTVDVTVIEPGGTKAIARLAFSFTSVVFGGDIRRTPSINIQQTLNNGPNRASFTIDQSGVPPIGGEKVILTDGATLLFTGEVSNVGQTVEDDKQHWAWDVTAIDERFRFNRKRPFGTWDNVSASTIARELITKYAPEFYADFVQSRLPKISLVLDGEEDMLTVFTKIAGALKEGHWYIDNGTVHLFQLATGLGTSETPMSALVMPAIAAMTAAVSTTSTLGYGFVPGYYYFMSANGYGVPPSGGSAKVYDGLSGAAVTAIAGFANASGVFVNYGQGGTPSQTPLPNQSGAPLWILLSEQAANRNLQGDISNGVYCDNGHLFARGWIGIKSDGSIVPFNALPAADANTFYFASSDVWFALEQASGTPAAPAQAYFESALSQISNPVYLEKFLPNLTNIPVGAVIGGRSCTLRKIFAIRLADAHLVGGTTIQGYATINDNATTSLIAGPTPSFIVPQHQNVNPPVGPNAQMTVVESTTAVDTTAFLGRNAQAGWWSFKVTGVYRDGTESRSSLASAPVLMSGLNQASAFQIPTFPTINGVDCVFRRVYGSVFFRASAPTTVGVPDFDVSDTQCVAILPDNTADKLTFPFGSDASGGEHAPYNVPPGEEDLPGPSLEDTIAPEAITSSSTQLLLSPSAIRPESDTTQLRNRIYVKGRGSVLAADAAVGDVLIKLSDVSTFSAGGGTFIVGSRIFTYNKIDASAIPPTLTLATALAQPILQADWKFGGGTPILPIVVVDDIASQKFYGQLELDKNGKPTDGIHEYTITDNSLANIQQLYARGFAELKLFSRPIVTIKYATRDPLTKAGKIVRVDLDKPPITGNFIIQEVVIDQIHDENDALAPRYTVTADSAARFNMNDLLLQLSESSGEKADGSPSGIVSTTVNIASTQIIAQLASIPGMKIIEIPAAPVNTWLFNRFTNPLELVAAVAGVTHIPVWCGLYSKITGTGGNYVNGSTAWEIEWVPQFGTLPQMSLPLSLGLDTSVISPAINRAFLSAIFNFSTNNVANTIFAGVGKPLLLQSASDISGGTNGVAGLTLVYFDTTNGLY